MYILVCYCDDYGLEYCGKFTSHREAYEYIADGVAEGCHDFDIMSLYPLEDDGYSVYRDNGTEIFAGMNWCTCHFRNYSDYYLIIEI